MPVTEHPQDAKLLHGVSCDRPAEIVTDSPMPVIYDPPVDDEGVKSPQSGNNDPFQPGIRRCFSLYSEEGKESRKAKK